MPAQSSPAVMEKITGSRRREETHFKFGIRNFEFGTINNESRHLVCYDLISDLAGRPVPPGFCPVLGQNGTLLSCFRIAGTVLDR